MNKQEIEEELSKLPEHKPASTLVASLLAGGLSAGASAVMAQKGKKTQSALVNGTLGAITGLILTKFHKYKQKRIADDIKREALRQIYNNRYGDADNIPGKYEGIFSRIVTTGEAMRG